MVQKSFFERRSVQQICGLECALIDTPEGLVDRIENLNPSKQSLILDFPLVHPEFDEIGDALYKSRTTMRGVKRIGDKRIYPSYVKLRQPRSKVEAREYYKRGLIPFRLRSQALFSMKKIPESENFNVGYMVWPVSGQDISPMFFSFWSIMEGTILDAYTGRICKQLPSKFLNAGAHVERDYAPEIIVKVPSRTKGSEQYTQRWSDVPTNKMPELSRAVIGWNTRPAYGVMRGNSFIEREDASPTHKFYNFSHEGKHRDGESFKFTMIYPHCFAGHQQIIRHFMRQGDLSPLEMSQFSVSSREDMAFHNKTKNNLLIREKNEKGKPVLRHLRIEQLSMLTARRIAKKIKKLEYPGDIQETMYWDPERDGKICDYPCLPGEE